MGPKGFYKVSGGCCYEILSLVVRIKLIHLGYHIYPIKLICKYEIQKTLNNWDSRNQHYTSVKEICQNQKNTNM